eukprot:TRINITY_DN344_c0_g1_i14.p2 TRINITY_DN344_c0_g1~~TRINITY_DN344_c0_g1_i14.p2  ORF type:complete len:284 (-),score=81.40 TRINITY_DN344_c0_g1_i14:46-807(-)
MVAMFGVSADEVGLGSLTRGSAIVQLEAYSDKGCAAEKEVVMDAWGGDGCEVAKAMNEPCGTVRVMDVFCLANDGSGVSGVAPGTVAAGAALASWAIALVAVLGALVVLVLVCLALWVVYRRSSDSSASEYSSSGPLGVPDPDDLLYNESVVRDVYGRSNGAGPTAEAAAERAKEAELRDEFPRPRPRRPPRGGIPTTRRRPTRSRDRLRRDASVPTLPCYIFRRGGCPRRAGVVSMLGGAPPVFSGAPQVTL